MYESNKTDLKEHSVNFSSLTHLLSQKKKPTSITPTENVAGVTDGLQVIVTGFIFLHYIQKYQGSEGDKTLTYLPSKQCLP